MKMGLFFGSIALLIWSCVLSKRFVVLADDGSCRWVSGTLICKSVTEDYLKTYACPRSYYYNYVLSVDSSNLSVIDSDSFRNCKYSKISITSSGVHNVTGDAFKKYINLYTLLLDKNEIEDLQFCGRLISLVTLSASYNKIRDLSAVKNLKNLENLFVSNNFIDVLTPSLFINLLKLTWLDLSSNKITDLPDQVFDGLSKLRTLELQENPIHFLASSAFAGINNLVKLNLSNCELVDLKSTLANEHLETLDLSVNRLQSSWSTSLPKTLKILNIHGNPEARVMDSRALSNLNALAELKVSLHNESIDRNTFSGMSALTTLTIRDGDIFSVQNNPFEYLTKLRGISLFNITIKELCLKSFLKASQILYVGTSARPNLNDKISNLNFSSLSIEILIPDIGEVSNKKTLNVSLNHNNIAKISTHSFYNISNLDVLRLDNNLIEIIEEKAFEFLSFKQCTQTRRNYYYNQEISCNNELYLNHNLLKTIKRNSFKTLKNVCKIYLNNNVIEEIEPLAFDGLSMHGNYFDRNTYNAISSPNQLCLSNNSIKKILNHTFAGVINLKSLLLNRNQIYFIEENAFVNLTNLTTLDLSNNKLANVTEKIFASLNNLQSLDLSVNFIESLNSESFFGLSKLNALKLSSNKLSDLAIGTFRPLTNLYKLEIDQNKMSKFRTGIFSKLVLLNSLNISHNLFPTLDWTVLYPLRKLGTLDVSDNRLENLDYASLKMHLPELKTIGVSGNQWKCKLLITMLRFFRIKDVKYHLHNHTLEYDRENVEGVYCYEDTEPLSTTSRTLVLPKKIQSLANKTSLLKSFVSINVFENKDLSKNRTQDKIVERLLEDILTEIRWQAARTTDNPDVNTPLPLSIYGKEMIRLLEDIDVNLRNISTRSSVDVNRPLLKRLIEIAENSVKSTDFHSAFQNISRLHQLDQQQKQQNSENLSTHHLLQQNFEYQGKIVDLLEMLAKKIQHEKHVNITSVQVQQEEHAVKMQPKVNDYNSASELKKLLEQIMDDQRKVLKEQEKLENRINLLGGQKNDAKSMEAGGASETFAGMYVNLFLSLVTLSLLLGLVTYWLCLRKSRKERKLVSRTNLLSSQIELSSTS